MTVQPDHLESFLAVARAGSVNRAATGLHRSQPNVTRQIQLLERHLDALLFDRAPDGMRLTAAGEALLPIAESITASFTDARRAVRAATREPVGTVRLIVVGTLADDALVQALEAFRHRCQDVEVRIGTGLSAAVSASVCRGDADLGLRYGIDDDQRLACTIVADEPIVAVAAAGHPLAGRARVTPAKARSHPWLVFESATLPSDEPYTAALQATLATLGVSNEQLSPVDSLSAQKVLVRAGLGLALLPASAVREELESGRLVSLPLAVRPRTAPIALVRRRSAFVGAAARELAETVIDTYRPRPGTRRRGSRSSIRTT